MKFRLEISDANQDTKHTRTHTHARTHAYTHTHTIPPNKKDLPAPNNAAYSSRSDNLISVMADTGHDAAAIAVLATAAVTVPDVAAVAVAAAGIFAVVAAPAIVAVVDTAGDDAHAAFTTGPNGSTNKTTIVAINTFLATFHRDDDDDSCKEESPRREVESSLFSDSSTAAEWRFPIRTNGR